MSTKSTLDSSSVAALSSTARTGMTQSQANRHRFAADLEAVKMRDRRPPTRSGIGQSIHGALVAVALLLLPAAALAQSDASLSYFSASEGTLTPIFSSSTFSYTATVPTTTTSITVTPYATDPAATVTVNGTSVTYGYPSAPIGLSVGTNLIATVVVSQDRSATNTYTLAVTRLAPSSNAALAGLVPSVGTLTPAFSSNILSYTDIVGGSFTAISVTPTAADANATITVNGNLAYSGNPYGPITLNAGTNVITTVVAAQDGVTTNTYTLTVVRTANADLAGLMPSVGMLTPFFAADTFSYTVSVPYKTNSVSVTPTASDPNAKITVNGSAVVSGNPSGPLSLDVGANLITIAVVSADSTATNTYTLNVNRDGPITVVNTATYTGDDHTSTITLAASYGTLGVDKLVVTVGGEHSYPNGVGVLKSVTYAGVPLTLAVKRDNTQGAYQEAAVGIFYLDNPSQYGAYGDVVLTTGGPWNSGGASVMSLVGTGPGLDATNCTLATTTTRTESTSLNTKSLYNVVVAVTENGAGNTGVQPYAQPPMTQVLSYVRPGSRYTAGGSGYLFVNGLASVSPTFTNTATTYSGTTLAVSFGVAVPSLYWDIDGATAGAGGPSPAGTWDGAAANWSTNINGDGNALVWSANQMAIFAAGTNATGTYTVNVNGTRDISGLNFEEGTVTLAGGTALRLSSLAFLNAAAGLTATVQTPLSEDAAGRDLVKAGPGTITLAGNNTYSGTTTVAPDGGTLVLSGNNVAATGGMTLNGGVAQFESPAAINGTARNVTVNSNGAVAFGPSFGAANIPAALSGRIVAASPGAIAADNYAATDFNFNSPGLAAASLGAASNVTYTGTLTPNGTTYRLGGGGGTLTMANANAITGAGNSLFVNGNVILPAANNFAAGTTLNAGTLSVGNDNCLGSGSLTLNGGGIASDSASARTLANALTVAADAFLGNAANNGKLTFSGPTALGATTRLLTLNSDVEFSGPISGTVGLTKTGPGTLTLSGTNTYSGLTSVNNGTLVLLGANTAAGGTTLNSGTTLQLGGSPNGGLGGGTLTFGAAFATIIQPIGADRTITNPVVLTYNATAGGIGTITGSQNLEFSGTFTQAGVGGSRTLTSSLDPGKALTLSGQVKLSDGNTARTLTINGTGETRITGQLVNGGTGACGLTKSGTGLLVLAHDNLYTSVTTAGGGVLQLNTTNALPGGIGTTGGTSALTFSGGVLGLGAGDFTRSLAAAGTVTGVNFTGNGGWAAFGANRLVNLGGASDILYWSVAGTGLNGKTLILGASNATHMVTLQNPLDLDMTTCTVQVDDGAAAVDATLSGILSDWGGLSKTGSGTLNLPAVNTYTGDTTVGAGTLLVNGSIASSTVTVAAGATLGGSGTLSGSVVNNGTLSPGAGVGTLATGLQTWNGGASYRLEISSALNSAGHDLLNISGTLDLEASSSSPFTVKLVSMADSTHPGLVPDFNRNSPYSWVVATASGGILNFNADSVTVDTTAFANPCNGSFSVAVQGNSLVVNYTPAPTITSCGPRSGTSFPLTFSGPSGQSYQVLSSTNVALPLPSWTVLSSGTFGASPVTYTDIGATNAQQFYRIKSP